MPLSLRLPSGGAPVTFNLVRVDGAARRVTEVRQRFTAPRPATGTPAPQDADPRLTGVGCRIPYAQLERITPGEAEARPGKDVSGCLVLGPLPAGCVGTDVYVEAQAQTQTLVAACALSYVTMTGLQRDENGYPLKLHPIRQMLLGSGYTLDHFDISWCNDGWANAGGGTLNVGVVRDHAHYIYKGDRQHPDGNQAYGGGNLSIYDVSYYNDAPAWPLGADGQKVPVSGTTVDKNGVTYAGPTGASSSIMFNHDKPYTGPVVVERTHTYGGTSVAFNLPAGIDPGETTDCWRRQFNPDGSRRLGFFFADNIIEAMPGNSKGEGGVARGPLSLFREQMFPNATTFKWSPSGDVGASTEVAVRADDGVSLRNVRRSELVI